MEKNSDNFKYLIKNLNKCLIYDNYSKSKLIKNFFVTNNKIDADQLVAIFEAAKFTNNNGDLDERKQNIILNHLDFDKINDNVLDKIFKAANFSEEVYKEEICNTYNNRFTNILFKDLIKNLQENKSENDEFKYEMIDEFSKEKKSKIDINQLVVIFKAADLKSDPYKIKLAKHFMNNEMVDTNYNGLDKILKVANLLKIEAKNFSKEVYKEKIYNTYYGVDFRKENLNESSNSLLELVNLINEEPGKNDTKPKSDVQKPGSSELKKTNQKSSDKTKI
jgi:hypothetical protein